MVITLYRRAGRYLGDPRLFSSTFLLPSFRLDLNLPFSHFDGPRQISATSSAPPRVALTAGALDSGLDWTRPCSRYSPPPPTLLVRRLVLGLDPARALAPVPPQSEFKPLLLFRPTSDHFPRVVYAYPGLTGPSILTASPPSWAFVDLRLALVDRTHSPIIVILKGRRTPTAQSSILMSGKTSASDRP